MGAAARARRRNPGTGVPEGMVLVNDLYEGQRLVPDFDMDLNQYDTEKFVEENGFIRYQDGKAVAGVDVSEHQGTIDWQQVKDAGFEYAILRVAYRGMTEGGLNVDSTCRRAEGGGVLLLPGHHPGGGPGGGPVRAGHLRRPGTGLSRGV